MAPEGAVTPHFVIAIASDPGLRVAGIATAVGLAATPRASELRAAEVVKVPAEKVDGDARLIGSAIMAEELARWAAGWAWAIVAELPIGATHEVHLIAEWPKVLLPGHQRESKARVDPNDLLPLSGVDVGWVTLAKRDVFRPPCTRVVLASPIPSEWKGQTPKDETLRRVLKRLSPAETAKLPRLPRGGYDHNLVDATAILLHHLGRFERDRGF
jgi:hypothetical protein